MSVKVATFANIITNPLNLHNFLVTIPGVDLAIVVSSTNFPSEKLREIVLWYQGEKIIYPGLPESENKWKVKLPENDDGKVRRAFDSLKSTRYNQKTGIMVPKLWKTVTVTARDLEGNEVFKVNLHGTWLKGRNPVDLANNDPSKSWEWEYEFVFQWIEDVDCNNKGSIPQI